MQLSNEEQQERQKKKGQTINQNSVSHHVLISLFWISTVLTGDIKKRQQNHNADGSSFVYKRRTFSHLNLYDWDYISFEWLNTFNHLNVFKIAQRQVGHIFLFSDLIRLWWATFLFLNFDKNCSSVHLCPCQKHEWCWGLKATFYDILLCFLFGA